MRIYKPTQATRQGGVDEIKVGFADFHRFFDVSCSNETTISHHSMAFRAHTVDCTSFARHAGL